MLEHPRRKTNATIYLENQTEDVNNILKDMKTRISKSSNC
jgi:hypothetical protein